MNRVKPGQHRLIVSLLTVVLVLGGMTVLTVGAAPPSSTIYGCVTTSSGVLYRVGHTEPERCNDGDTLISWSQSDGAITYHGAWQESASPYQSGAIVTHDGGTWISVAADNTKPPEDGDNGWDLLAQTGDTPPQSGSGVRMGYDTMVLKYSPSASLPSFAYNCPGGYFSVGAGGQPLNPDNSLRRVVPILSTAAHGVYNVESWQISMQSGGITVSEICVKEVKVTMDGIIAGPWVQIVSLVVAPGQTSGAVYCPEGHHAIGGGAGTSAASSTSLLVSSRPIGLDAGTTTENPAGWYATRLIPTGGEEEDFQIFASCVQTNPPTEEGPGFNPTYGPNVVVKQQLISGSSASEATATCDEGQHIIGGGAIASPTHISSMYPTTDGWNVNSWTATRHPQDVLGGSIQAFAICVADAP